MSVAFTREEGAQTAAETQLPDRLVSPHPNLVTESGLKALNGAMADARARLTTPLSRSRTRTNVDALRRPLVGI